jgi:hypothetical protein
MGNLRNSDARKIKLVASTGLAACFLLVTVALSPMDIAYDSGNTLSLRTDVVLESFFDVDSSLWGVKPPEADVTLEGDMDKKAGFELALQSEGLYDGKPEKIIDTCEVWFALADDIRLELGQFKAPFGEEVLWGKKKRPYPFHSESSKEIAPGRDRGASIELGKILDLAKLEVGVFNGAGAGAGADIIDLNRLLCTGKLSVKPRIADFIDLEAGYGLLYGLESLGVLVHTIGQGIYANVEVKPAKDITIGVFSEYMEKRNVTGAINDESGWSLGSFSLVSFRIDAFEGFATFEMTRLNSTYEMPGDMLVSSGGICFFPTNEMRVSLVYRGEYGLYDRSYGHEVSTLLFYRL